MEVYNICIRFFGVFMEVCIGSLNKKINIIVFNIKGVLNIKI